MCHSEGYRNFSPDERVRLRNVCAYERVRLGCTTAQSAGLAASDSCIQTIRTRDSCSDLTLAPAQSTPTPTTWRAIRLPAYRLLIAIELAILFVTHRIQHICPPVASSVNKRFGLMTHLRQDDKGFRRAYSQVLS